MVRAQAASTTPLDRIRAATVTFQVEGVSGSTSGSGVVLTDQGVVVTNAHVVQGARRVRVKVSSGEVFEAVGALDYDPRLDVAFVVIPGFGLPVAALGNSDSVVVGQRLIAIGAPLGLEMTVTDGLLSAIRLDDGAKRFQISIPIAPGSSGGPIVNEKGELVALAVSGIRGGGAENLNFAVPINSVRGKLRILSSKTPVPFGELAYTPVTQPTVPASGVGANTLARVNADLVIDFSALDGIQTYFEHKGERGWSFKEQITYAVSRSPSGMPVLERISTMTGRAKVAPLRSEDMQEETLRTVFHAGGPNQSSTFYSLRPFYSSITPAAWELHVEGTRFRLLSNVGPREGDAAPGIIPGELTGAVIATLPDSIPDETRFWVLDATASRSQEAVLQVLERDTTKVPVPATGGGCDKRTITKDVKAGVIRGRLKVGTYNSEVALLAARPHVRVDNVKCVFLPGGVPAVK